jgi:4-hydroxy-tetrahydrodipicolinate reductase
MKIALIGYGKMGKTIEKLAMESGHSISFIIDKDNIKDIDLPDIRNTDAIIEFSEPAYAYNNVTKCLRKGIRVVCGTTGWEIPVENITELCSNYNTAFIQSSNFNVGTHLFFLLNRIMSEKSASLGYKVSIEEIHHIYKKDKPSGTAITLAKNIIGSSPLYKEWKLAGDKDMEKNAVIPVTSIRQGEVAGIHTSKWVSDSDMIEISHVANNRQGFAAGALKAASFLQEKTGYFTMNDLLTEMIKL